MFYAETRKDKIFALTVDLITVIYAKEVLVTTSNILLEKFYENHKSPQSNGTTASLYQLH